MDWVRTTLESASAWLGSAWEAVALSCAFLVVAFVFEYAMRRRIKSKSPDAMGFRILENHPGQTLVRIKFPGNVRHAGSLIELDKNLLLRFSKMSRIEFKYAIFLLRSLGLQRRSTVYLVDKGLFLIKKHKEVESTDSTKLPPILDLEGNEVEIT